MTTHKVYVKRKLLVNRLRLRDSQGNRKRNADIITKVNPGDIVEWHLDDNSRLKCIAGIARHKAKKGQTDLPNLFEADPKPDGNGVWKARIVSISPGKDTIMKYNIGFRNSNGSGPYWEDPKLQMNS